MGTNRGGRPVSASRGRNDSDPLWLRPHSCDAITAATVRAKAAPHRGNRLSRQVAQRRWRAPRRQNLCAWLCQAQPLPVPTQSSRERALFAAAQAPPPDQAGQASRIRGGRPAHSLPPCSFPLWDNSANFFFNSAILVSNLGKSRAALNWPAAPPLTGQFCAGLGQQRRARPHTRGAL
jgi:hypothetical protein